MARYGTFKYGDGTTYGNSPATSNLLWSFLVDWNNSGTFNQGNEAGRMVDFTAARGRDDMLRPSGYGFELFNPGQVSAVFTNDDGRYDPYNASSPLYPNVRPGKRVWIKVKNGNSGTDYDVMYGTISDIQPFSRGVDQYCRLVVYDGLRWLRDQQVLLSYKTSASVQTIVETILDLVDWPWSVSADDSGQMSSTKAYWWVWKSPAWDELRDLAESEAAHFFHGRDGTLYFYNRDFGHNRTQAVTQSEILREIVIPFPWDSIRNDIHVSAYLKTEEDKHKPWNDPTILNQVWGSTGGSSSFIDLDNGQTVVIDADFRQTGYDKFAVTNEEDFWAISMISPPYSDITASCSIVYTATSQGTRFHITNNSGLDARITGGSMYGDIVSAFYTTARQAQDLNNQGEFGRRVLKLDGYWQESLNTAQDIADWLLDELKDPLAGVTIQFEDRPTYQFLFDLYDRVELTIAAKDVNANYRVGKIEHEWLSDNGQQVRTTLKLEPYLEPFGLNVSIREVVIVSEAMTVNLPTAGTLDIIISDGVTVTESTSASVS